MPSGGAINRPKMKHSIYPPQPMPKQEAIDWLRLIHYAAGNKAANPALVLRITPLTFSRWMNGAPPSEWWYREVFRATIELYVKEMRKRIRQTRSPHIKEVNATRIKIIESRLTSLPSDQYFINKMNTSYSPQFTAARRLILEHMPRGKKVLYSLLTDLRLDAGIALRTFAKAADDLGVERGRNSDARSWWRLPEQEDED